MAAWKVAPLTDLVHHLVGTCHLECRVDMARLETLVELLVLEDGKGNRPLLDVRELIGQFCREMRAHLSLEERNLFPFILAMENGEGPANPAEALEPVRKLLEGDHETEAGLLRTIRGLAATLAAAHVPGSLLGRIQDTIKMLSERLQKHLYLENQILFRRIA
jgi:regulator of cell morphogenesis and NO signaling